MADFNVAFQITNGNEGGWQNDPNDRGNASNGLGTYRGIASAEQPNWHGWLVIRAAIVKMGAQPQYDTGAYRAWAHQLNATLSTNNALQGMVRDFYQVNFWNVNRLGDLTCQDLANRCYDAGVNQGTGTAAKMLQGVLGVAVDGRVGPITITAANGRDGAALTEAFRQARIAHYHATVAAHAGDARYLDEWISRC